MTVLLMHATASDELDYLKEIQKEATTSSVSLGVHIIYILQIQAM